MISHIHRELQPGTITLPNLVSLKQTTSAWDHTPLFCDWNWIIFHLHRELQSGTVTLSCLVSPKLDDISPSQRTPARDHHTPQSSVSEADNFSLGSYSSILWLELDNISPSQRTSAWYRHTLLSSVSKTGWYITFTENFSLVPSHSPV